MKKLLLFIAVISLVGCMQKEVKFGDKDLEMPIMGTVTYKGKPFTGVVVQDMNGAQIRLEYKDGKLVKKAN